MNKNRLEAFSDGVFAIIITIMVLELKIPKGTGWEAIKPLLPTLYCYLISFVYIGIYWNNHHHLMHTARTVSAAMMWANMHLLFWLSLVPFVTGWMGENCFDRITVATYGALLCICGFAYSVLSGVIKKSGDTETPLAQALKRTKPKEMASLVLYSLSIPLALLVNPFMSEAIYVIVAIMWIIPSKDIERALMEHKGK
jgi:uncharacterized membrane protein